MSLQNPMDDPAPLFAMAMNAVVLTAGGMIENGLEKAGNIGKAGLDTGKKAFAVAKDMAPTGPSSPEAPQTVKAMKEEMARSPEVTPPIPEHVQATALAAVGKETKMDTGREAANDSNFVGQQGVAASIEGLGKPIAVAAQTQSQGIGMG